METRLLHPGVSTPDILTAYIAAIRSMRVLDPTGLLLETVTQPVHQYLRSREDTVRYSTNAFVMLSQIMYIEHEGIYRVKHFFWNNRKTRILSILSKKSFQLKTVELRGHYCKVARWILKQLTISFECSIF